jgi:O-antigen/teichoic acid export membrane protein
MSLNTRIAKNSLIQLVGKLLSLFLGLATIAVMTRFLGQEGFGYYTTVISFLQVFGILVDFGLSLTAVQMITRPGANSDKTMSNLMTLRTISAFIFLILGAVVVWFFPYPVIVKVGVLITSASFFCNSLTSVLTSVFQKELKMFQITLAEVISRVVLVALTLAAAVWGKNLYWFLAVFSIANAVNLILAYLYSRKYVKLKFAFDKDVWVEIIKRTWPMALSISFNLIYLRMDAVILSLVRSPNEVGLYGAAYRVLDILTLLPAVYMGIVLPHLTSYFNEKKKAEFFELMQKSFDALMLFGVPIVCGTFLVAGKVMTLIAGREFAFSGEMLKVLIVAVGAIFVTSLFGYAVVAINKQRPMMWGYLTAAILTLVGYLIFIPKFGWQGAAVMTVFSELVIMIWTAIMVYKTVKFFPNLIFTVKSLIASLIMVAVVFLIINSNIVLILLIAAVVYFGLMVAFGAVRRDFLKEMIKVK